MNLMALDFWSVVWAFLGLAALGIIHRLVWALARMSDNLIGFLAHMGLKGLAKFLLTILVDYDQKTYAKSRFSAWNQVPFRFAVLWGATLGLLGLLCILKVGRSIDSVGMPLALISIVCTGYRCVQYWNAPRRNEVALNSFNQNFKEQPRPTYSMIRQWDYLDELFIQTQ